MDYMDLAVPRKPLNLIPHPLTHYVQKQVYMPVSEWLNVDFCPDIIVPYGYATVFTLKLDVTT